MRTIESECMPWRTLARVQLSPSSALIMTPCPTVPTRMFPLIVMLHLLIQRESRDALALYRNLPRRGALDGAPGGRDLRRRRVAARKRTLGPLVPAARVVKVTLEDVDDAVQPRPQRGFVLLDDLVRLLPFARGQMLDRSVERVAHGSLHVWSRLQAPRGGAARDVLAPRRPREQRRLGGGPAPAPDTEREPGGR